MAHTTSLAFPSMFDVARNKVAVLEDNPSVVNRVRLLLLTDPTEVFNSPTQGAGLKRYMFQYNTDNTKALVKSRIKDQLREFEPSVTADATQFIDGLPLTGGTANNQSSVANASKLELTVGLSTVYGDDVEINIDDGSISQ